MIFSLVGVKVRRCFYTSIAFKKLYHYSHRSNGTDGLSVFTYIVKVPALVFYAIAELLPCVLKVVFYKLIAESLEYWNRDAVGFSTAVFLYTEDIVIS
jgi:hypothetical protein